MARIIWSEQALADLEAILSYLEQQSHALACRFAQSIVDRIDQLEVFPLSGSVVPEDRTETYRQLLQGSYRIIYRVEEEQVLIVATHHAAQLLDCDSFG